MLVWLYSLISVLVVSMIAFVGILTFSLNENMLKKILLYLVSFAAGALFGGVFLHMIPEAVGEYGLTIPMSFYIMSGIIASFVLEKFIRWRHCHIPTSKNHPHPVAYMNLFGDAAHNFMDGIIIAASYMANIPLGIATTLAVIAHEIPQEIGDFGILVYGGFTKKKALFVNFLTALTSIAGATFALIFSFFIKDITAFLILFAAGGFIYIAGSDLVPELHKELSIRKSAFQLITFFLGMLVMLVLTFI